MWKRSLLFTKSIMKCMPSSSESLDSTKRVSEQLVSLTAGLGLRGTSKRMLCYS